MGAPELVNIGSDIQKLLREVVWVPENGIWLIQNEPEKTIGDTANVTEAV